MSVVEILSSIDNGAWSVPEITADIPHGDMPGDKVEIGESHIEKAKTIFPELVKLVKEVVENRDSQRAVITVCGGSGVGKSEIASLLSYFFNQAGIGSYTLSGDNYPRRIPMYNDAERLKIFRESGLLKMVHDGVYTPEHFEFVHELQLKGEDANKDYIKDNEWFASYINGGIEGLKGYLGTPNESNFKQVEDILDQFKAGNNEIYLKRMGRTDTELWFEKVDFSNINILIIEWTHGNNDCYEGVDVPILLNSTPEETLAHRRARNRDGKTDSPFTTRVLEIEQGMLHSQAHKAKIIVSKSGELLTFEQYSQLMDGQF